MEGETLFKLNCSACHTVGQGKLIGPDLKDVHKRHDTEWIKKFIRSSQTLIRNGDPVALKVYNENGQILMPDQPALTANEIDELLDYIRNTSQIIQRDAVVSLNPGQNNGAGQFEKGRVESSAPGGNFNEEVLKGRELFLGLSRLKAGGPSCNSCHNVTEDKQPEGGIFAPDLTNVYSRIDEKEMMELATAPKYPSMQRVYRDKPIGREEAKYIAAFLKYAGTTSTYQQERDQRAADLLKRFKKEGQE